ncbi:MAG TPA: TIGR01906 family membrane protein [Dehalococcoidia bacterium]
MEQMFERKPRSELGLLRMIGVGLFVIAVPIALITTTIRVAVSEKAFYDYAVQDYGAQQTSGIPTSELTLANGQVRHYLVSPDAGPLAVTVTDNAGVSGPLFNARETVHLADVRSLLQLMFKIQLLSVALVLTLATAMVILWPTRVLAAAALWGGLLTTAVIGIVGAVAVSGFDAAWTQFHQLAFTNSFWQLNPLTDHLIQMYPDQFWQDVTTALGGFLMVQAVGLTVLSATYLVLTRPNGNLIEARLRPAQPDRDGHPRHPRLMPPNPRNYVQ